jgi:hypothetical protein
MVGTVVVELTARAVVTGRSVAWEMLEVVEPALTPLIPEGFSDFDDGDEDRVPSIEFDEGQTTPVERGKRAA